MRRTTRFRNLLLAPEILVLPGAHDALSVRLIAKAGFQAFTAGGFATTATLLGQPDVNQLTMTEMAEQYARLADLTDLPLFADGDTGHGNVTNVARTVRAFERAGVAALFIEDQVIPKRCGHMAGKAVIPKEEMVGKVKAALDARIDADMVIMARTDALAVNGLDDAIDRAQAYRAAGADLIFVEAPTTEAEMLRICREIDAPTLANNIENGMSPLLPAARLQEIGYAAVAFPVGATFLIGKALQAYYTTLARDGTTDAVADRLLSFAAFTDLVELPALRARETEYQRQAAALVQDRQKAS